MSSPVYLKFDVDVFSDHFLYELTSDKVRLYKNKKEQTECFLIS